MKKIVILGLGMLLFLPGRATHLIGGNFEVNQIGRNLFNVNLRVFRNCKPGAVDLATPNDVRVYRSVDNTLAAQFDYTAATGVPVNVGDECYNPDLCVEEYYFQNTLSLPDQPLGYYVVWSVCCRNAGLSNIVSNGSDAEITFYTAFADPAIGGGNSSPRFGGYPEDGYFCSGIPTVLNWPMTDPDGDQLQYSFINPLEENNGPKPFATVTWKPGYGPGNILGTGSSMTINPSTGDISVIPSSQGIFAFAVLIEEFRNGAKIGETVRDVQFESLICTLPPGPVFTEPTVSEFTARLGEELCFPLRVTQSNGDTIFLRLTSPLIGGKYQAVVSGTGQGAGTVDARFCWTPDCSYFNHLPESWVYAKAWVKGCRITDTVYWNGSIRVEPITELEKKNLPNTFSPNGDAVNDEFRLAGSSFPCIEDFNIVIMNRWGSVVFRSNDQMFSWNGHDASGKLSSEGVYYYVVKGRWQDDKFEFTNHVTLFR